MAVKRHLSVIDAWSSFVATVAVLAIALAAVFSIVKIVVTCQLAIASDVEERSIVRIVEMYRSVDFVVSSGVLVAPMLSPVMVAKSKSFQIARVLLMVDP
jgi:hypothetical protein